MPNPKLETYKNKATGTVYDFTDADAQSKISATVDLLKDTTGWIGGNLNASKYSNVTEANYAFTANDDGTVTGEIKNVTASTQTSNCSPFTAPFSAQVMLSGGVSGEATIYPWDVTTDTRPYTDSTKTTRQTGDDTGSGLSFWMEEGHQYKLRPRFMANASIQRVMFKPMLLTVKQYALNPTYRPNHGTVDEVKADKTGVISVLNDTVGWIGKSIVPNNLTSRSSGGVTVTVNADKSVTLDTGGVEIPSAVGFTLNNWFTGIFKEGVRYKLSDVNGSTKCYTYLGRKKGESGQAVYNIDTTGAIEGRDYFTYKSNEYDYYLYSIYVLAGTILDNVTLYPMITEADVYELSPSYEPYHDSVEDWYWNNNTKTGVHNFAINNVVSNPNDRGISYTVNDDLSITFNSGTATESFSIPLSGGYLNKLFAEGDYVLSDEAGSASIYTTLARKKGSSGTPNYAIVTASVRERSFTVNYNEYDYFNLYLYVISGTTISTPITFKPMIRLANDTNKDYIPPAMTNRQLTDMLTTKDVTVTAGTDVTVNTNTYVYSKAGVVTGSLRLEIGATLTAGATIATLSAKPKNTTYAIGIDNMDKSVMPIIIGNNGAVQLFGGFIPTSGNQLLIPIAYATA